MTIGGSGTYDEIYAAVKARRSDLPPTWQAIIRRTIEQSSSDTSSFLAGNADVFFSVNGIGSGTWGLRGGTAAVLNTIDTERERRKKMWDQLTAAPEITAAMLKKLDVYRGQAGIFFDKAITEGPLSGSGIALSFRHTGETYADDLSDDGVIYHYPSTKRGGSHDEGEIESARTAFRLAMPVFVITGPKGASVRGVRLGYVEDYDDAAKFFLITFAQAPLKTVYANNADPFELTGALAEPTLKMVRSRPNQQRFAAAVFKLYGSMCAACGFDVAGIVVAAHLRPKKASGSDDPRNGLPLCANHHAAMDKGLWRLDPAGNKVVCAPGVTAKSLNLTQTDLSHLTTQPHADAVQWLWAKGFKPI